MGRQYDLNKIKELIKQRESSGGKNLIHKPAKTKVGDEWIDDTAGGAYGLRPEHIRTLNNRLKNAKLPTLKEIEDLKKLSNPEITKKISEDRDLDEKLMQAQLDLLSNRGYSPEMMAFKHNQGFDAPVDRLFRKDVADYVAPFRTMQDIPSSSARGIALIKEESPEEIEKNFQNMLKTYSELESKNTNPEQLIAQTDEDKLPLVKGLMRGR